MKHIIKQEHSGYFNEDTAIAIVPGDFVDLVGDNGAIHSYYAVERPNMIKGITTCADCDAGCDVFCFEYSFRCHDVLLKKLDNIMENL